MVSETSVEATILSCPYSNILRARNWWRARLLRFDEICWGLGGSFSVAHHDTEPTNTTKAKLKSRCYVVVPTQIRSPVVVRMQCTHSTIMSNQRDSAFSSWVFWFRESVFFVRRALTFVRLNSNADEIRNAFFIYISDFLVKFILFSANAVTNTCKFICLLLR